MPIRRLVEHSDVDAYRVVHFARYPAFMETAVLEELATRRLDIDELARQGLELRISEIRVRYKTAAVHRDVLHLAASVKHVGAVRFHVVATITRGGEGSEEEVAEGEFYMVIVESRSGHPFALTDEMRRHLGEPG